MRMDTRTRYWSLLFLFRAEEQTHCRFGTADRTCASKSSGLPMLASPPRDVSVVVVVVVVAGQDVMYVL